MNNESGGLFRVGLTSFAFLMLTWKSSLADPYNLRCIGVGDATPITLSIRDGLTRFSAPEIRVLNGKPGETSPVQIESYTDDKIKIEISIELSKYPKQQSALVLTIDRNIGSVMFDLIGPWQVAQGHRFRVTETSYTGQCKREFRQF